MQLPYTRFDKQRAVLCIIITSALYKVQGCACTKVGHVGGNAFGFT